MPTPDETTRTMIDNLEPRTGRSLDSWLALLGPLELTKHAEIVRHLKEQHGVTHGYANLIAAKALERPPALQGDLVEQAFSGPKAGLRPIYETIAAEVRRFGADVELAPKKGYVSLRRAKQFALLQPSTATRLDVGIQLKGRQPGGRLEASGSFSAMVSHRVRVGSTAEVDAELIAWLRDAYRAAG